MNATDYADIIVAITTFACFVIVSGTILILVNWWWKRR